MTPKEVLITARTHLSEPKRWIKGRLFDHDGVGACAVGAFELVSPMVYEEITTSYDGRPINARWPTVAPERLVALHYLTSVLGLSLTLGAIERWNDHPDRTHEEVLAAFDAAIALAEADEILSERTDKVVVVELPEGVEMDPIPAYLAEQEVFPVLASATPSTPYAEELTLGIHDRQEGATDRAPTSPATGGLPDGSRPRTADRVLVHG